MPDRSKIVLHTIDTQQRKKRALIWDLFDCQMLHVLVILLCKFGDRIQDNNDEFLFQ